MKKLFVIGAMCAASALGASAMPVTTSCGKVVETVSPAFFEDENGNIDCDEAGRYYLELDEANCGG